LFWKYFSLKSTGKSRLRIVSSKNMRPDVAEYLTLAYKGELAIREAKQESINRWAHETAKTLVERLKEELGTPDRPVYVSNIIGQVKEKKRKTGVPPVVPKFITQLGGTFDSANLSYNLPQDIKTENALLGAKVLMGRAFEFHMYPKALWGMAAIGTALMTIVSAYTVMVNYTDWINIAIFVCCTALCSICAFKFFRFESFQSVAKTIRDRVIRSKSMPE
jgi:hypothetical protein